jgi:hypothetical protein
VRFAGLLHQLHSVSLSSKGNKLTVPWR